MEKISEENTKIECELEDMRAIWGWENIEDVAKSVWSSIHHVLLEGDLVFAYKSSSTTDKLKQIVIVRNFTLGQNLEKTPGDFGVGYITSTYTALLPHIPLRYLKDEISQYLGEWKIDKTIQNTYKAIIEDLEKNG